MRDKAINCDFVVVSTPKNLSDADFKKLQNSIDATALKGKAILVEQLDIDYVTINKQDTKNEPTPSPEAILAMFEFIEEITMADGKYPELDGRPIVHAARRILAKARGKS